ncbi:unnamed protein product, partial [Rotaria magnacalcarata]
MDVNCCPRNDFSFPMKNNTKEFVSTWPTQASSTNNGLSLGSTLSKLLTGNGVLHCCLGENIFDQEQKPFQDYILRNTSNIMSFEQSCVLPFQQLVLNDLNPRTSSSSMLPFSFNNEPLPFGSSHQSNMNDENARPPWLLSIAPQQQ